MTPKEDPAMSDTMKFVNPTENTINLHAIGCGVVAPGGEVDIPLYLCAPGRTDAGNRGKSAVENVAPQLEPKDEADKKAWKAIPEAPTPVSKIVTIAPRPVAEPAGVKALREQKEAAAKAQASKPENKPQQATGAAQTNASAPAAKP